MNLIKVQLSDSGKFYSVKGPRYQEFCELPENRQDLLRTWFVELLESFLSFRKARYGYNEELIAFLKKKNQREFFGFAFL